MDCYTKMLVYPALAGLLVFFFSLGYAASLQELSNVCDSQLQHGASSAAPHHRRRRAATATNHNNSVADLWMCPICEPDNCEPWEMFAEGCFQYTWAFRLDNEASFCLSCFVLLW